MLRFPWMRSLAGGLFVAAMLAAPVAAQVNIINVIPRDQSSETGQNSEPSIAVNPTNTNQIVISTFGKTTPTNNPYFYSNNGGATFANTVVFSHIDNSLAWSPSGNQYAAFLTTTPSPNSITVDRSSTPDPAGLSTIGSSLISGGGLDQPLISANSVGGKDHVYVGFNGLGGAMNNTAAVRLTTDGQAATPAFFNARLDDTNPAQGDGPTVRVATANDGKTVYAAYQRFTGTAGGANADLQGNIIITRDDNAGALGAGSFQALKDAGTGKNGVAVTGSIRIPFGDFNTNPNGTKLGNERLGSDLAIAVDPNNAGRVYVTYASVTGGLSHVHVALSTDSGKTFANVYDAAPADASALPSIAVAAGGQVGLLYTSLHGGNLETHLVQSTDGFATAATDMKLFSFKDGSPARAFEPYIGDFEQVLAVGNTFYGTFSASNDPTLAIYKTAGLHFTFQREVLGGNLGDAGAKLGNGAGVANVALSIDPYFFSVRAVPEPASLALVLLGGGLCARFCRGRRSPAG